MNLPTLVHANVHLGLLYGTTVTSSCRRPAVVDVRYGQTFGRWWRGARAARPRGLAFPCG